MSHDPSNLQSGPQSELAIALQVAQLCRDLFFDQPFALHMPGHRKRIRRQLADILRDHVSFPPPLLGVMAAYASAAVAAAHDIDWTVTSLYSADEKERILDRTRGHAYAALEAKGDYRMPSVVFCPMAPDTKGRPGEAEYLMTGNLIKIAPELRDSTLEKLLALAVHEDGHALINQFRRNCFGRDFAILTQSPGMEWRKFKYAAKKELSEGLYDVCPEEAIVRRLAVHVVGLASQNRDEVTAVVASEMDGYTRHKAVRDLEAVLKAEGPRPE